MTDGLNGNFWEYGPVDYEKLTLKDSRNNYSYGTKLISIFISCPRYRAPPDSSSCISLPPLSYSFFAVHALGQVGRGGVGQAGRGHVH